MSPLSVTGPSVFIGENLVDGGIEFIPTNMDAVDARGLRAMNGGQLHIMKAPLTNGQRGHINEHLGKHHYGSMLMYESGAAYVVRRGPEGYLLAMPRHPMLDPDDVPEEMHSMKHGIKFVPDGALVLADPHFMTHPAATMTWYEAASLAAALEDADPQRRFRIRLMRSREHDRFVDWDSKYTAEATMKRAHLRWEGTRGTASVSDKAARRRTTDEGFVDVFGNVDIWMDDARATPSVYPWPTDDMDDVPRGISNPFTTRLRRDVYVARRYARPRFFAASGARFVAIQVH
jgi:hypothetical protein